MSLFEDAGTPNPQMICPHCQTKGCVTTKAANKKAGISGGKATAAVLTAGVSVLATGLSRKEKMVEAHCSNCGASWMFEGSVETPRPPKRDWMAEAKEKAAKAEEEAKKPVVCPSCQAEYRRTEKICPECGERNPTRLTILQTILCVIVVILVTILTVQACSGIHDLISTPSATPATTAQASAQTSAPKEEAKEEAHYIPGVAPVDIYLTLEKNGFQTQKDLGTENGNTWRCTKEQGGFAYDVSLWSPDVGTKIQNARVNVQSSDAIVGIGNGTRSIRETLWLFKGVASLCFSGDNSKKAEQWVEKHFKHDAETTIDGVKLEMKAPTKFARVLMISVQ